MNDQERITDLILTEKKMSANYDTFASECVNVQLRDEFLKLLNQGHQTQTKLFQTAQQASAAGQDDTSVRDIRSQFRGSLLQYAVNCFYNLHCRLFECLFCFFRRNLDGLGPVSYTHLTLPTIA